MEDFVQALIVLVLGWLLGILSPAIVDAIKGRRDAISGQAAIKRELKEFSSVLLAACFRAKSAHGSVDRGFLEWLATRLDEIDDEPSRRFASQLRPVLATPASDADLATVTRMTFGADGRATMLQKYAVPLLDQRVSALQSFDTSFQIKMLQVRRNIALLDAIVDQSKEFYRMTFSLQGKNHDLVADNLIQSYGEYAARAKIIADEISALQLVR